MRAASDLVSPMALAGLVLWVVVMVVVTSLAIPVFANVASGPEPVCPPTCAPQPQQLTTEWLPSLASGFLAASALLALCWGVVRVVRRRR